MSAPRRLSIWLSRAFHGALAWVGYLLSPLSWWNDAIVNLPLAYAFGAGVEAFYPGHFLGAVVLGYWLTNIVGLVLLHRGVTGALCRNPPCRYTRRMLAKDLAVSLVYTAAVALLAHLGVLVPPRELLGGG